VETFTVILTNIPLVSTTVTFQIKDIVEIAVVAFDFKSHVHGYRKYRTTERLLSMEKEFKKIIEYAKKRYGSFKTPKRSFVTFWLPDQCRLYKSLHEHYDLTEDSDFQ
jgi:hypothetical protein